MTLIIFKFAKPSATGRIPGAGSMTFTPTRRHVVESDPATVVLPKGFPVNVPATGLADVELAPNGPDWCWELKAFIGGVSGWVEYLAVPEALPDPESPGEYLPVDYTRLARVDPRTLEPTAEPVAAWWAGVDEMKQAAAGAQVSAGESAADVLVARGAATESAQSAEVASAAAGVIIEMTETGRLSTTALSDTIGELSGPVIDAKVAPVMASAQEVVDQANAGAFDGADGAPGNATMRVDTTVGTRIFITDGVTEHMISGDTSRRNVVDLLVNGWSVVATQNPILRREGNTVTLRAYLGRGSDPLALTVPAGFRASAIHVQGAFYGLGTPTNQVGVEVSSSGTVRLLGTNALNTTHYCYWRWETHDAWPTTLPGTPA